MKLESVARPSLVDTVAARIRQLIEQRHLQAGDRLPTEPELLADLGVSRTVLREAVGRLQSIGLLTIQRGRGMFVGDGKSLSNCAKLVRSALTISSRDWIRFSEFRAALEIEAARLAAQRGTAEDFRELENILNDMCDPAHSYMESVQHDFAFHLKIVAMSGNELMRNSLQVVHEFVIAAMVKTTQEPRDLSRSRKLHGDILEAIRSGDPARAEAAMREHMRLADIAIRAATGYSDKAAAM